MTVLWGSRSSKMSRIQLVSFTVVVMAAFSFSYISLSAGTGALLLFGAAQTTMTAYGLWAGERLTICHLIGVVSAGSGIVWPMPLLWTPSHHNRLCLVVCSIARIGGDHGRDYSIERCGYRCSWRCAASGSDGDSALWIDVDSRARRGVTGCC
jgi:hypothetical protein